MSALLRPHSFFERTCCQRKAKIVAHVLNRVRARRIEIAVSAFRFDDERRGFASHDFAIARRIARQHQTFDIAAQVQIAARQIGCVKALRRILGDRVGSPAFACAAELLIKAATSAPFDGRPMYAALRTIPIPDDLVARLFHAASLLREHRGDGHIAALMIEGVGGLEAHVLLALAMDMPAEKFGRIHHLPAAQLDAVIDGMRDRGLIGDDGWLSEQGRAVKERVESLTDDLAAKPYESLEPGELDELMDALEPLDKLLLAAQDFG